LSSGGRKKTSVLSWTAEQTAAVSSVLYQILTCPFESLTRRLFLESKATELIALHLDCLKGERPRRNQCLLPDAEYISKIYQAKDLLVRSVENPPGLFELAKIVGLSHSNLNKGFHQIFNTTVFGYLRTARMEEAKKILLDGDMNVTETAYAVGYSSLSHFSLAFRKYAGVNPGEIRQKQRT